MRRRYAPLAIAALVVGIALPASAQMRTSQAIGTPGRGPLALGLMGGYGAAGVPEAGLALDLETNGPINLHLGPRMTLGTLAPSYFLPVTIRPNEITDVPSVYAGLGPFAEISPTGTFGAGGLLEIGIRTPVAGPIELELGVEGGYRLTPVMSPTWSVTAGLLFRP